MRQYICVGLPRYPFLPGVKNLPAKERDASDWGLTLGQEDPLEEEMATPSGIPAWEIPRTEEPGGLQPMGP